MKVVHAWERLLSKYICIKMSTNGGGLRLPNGSPRDVFHFGRCKNGVVDFENRADRTVCNSVGNAVVCACVCVRPVYSPVYTPFGTILEVQPGSHWR